MAAFISEKCCHESILENYVISLFTKRLRVVPCILMTIEEPKTNQGPADQIQAI
jgi:hypothetical protein